MHVFKVRDIKRPIYVVSVYPAQKWTRQWSHVVQNALDSHHQEGTRKQDLSMVSQYLPLTIIQFILYVIIHMYCK
jgi:hypothetical protein